MGMRERGPDGRGGIASRPSGWPVLRTPKWMLAAGVVLVAGLVLAAVPHRPSTAAAGRRPARDGPRPEHDIESCAGGVSDSITALRAIQSGASNDVKTAVTIANTAAANCSPANSMPMEDLVQYQAPGSLASFHVQTAVNDLVTWGFPLAQRVQADVARLVTAKAPDAVKRSDRSAAQGSARARRAARPDQPADRDGQRLAVRSRGTAEPAQLRGEMVPLRAEIQIGLAAGRPVLHGHTVTYVKDGVHVLQVTGLTKDCNRLCDRAVTIRLTAMCHLTGFMVREDHHCQDLMRPCADPG